MEEVTAYAALGAILAHLLASTASWSFRDSVRRSPSRLSGLCSMVAVLLTFYTLVALTVNGTVEKSLIEVNWPAAHSLSFGVLCNGLSAVFGLTVATLALIIFRFSERYLDHDEAAARFFRWGHLTVAAVLAMIFSSNLALFWFAWLITSLALHELLTLYPNRPAAKFAAQKKFIVSRIGDVCIVAAGVLLLRTLGTLDFLEMSRRVAQLNFAAHKDLEWVAALLVVGAMTKSAQVPFHSWLPETLETPTPVSALMHAGVINAGGYLLLRTYGFVHLTAWASQLLCAVGMLSVAICGLTMLTATDIKRRLAHSTSAQMGFMFAQLGLGVPGAALLHMIGHAFFKAHGFLTCGSLPPRGLVVDHSARVDYLLAVATLAIGTLPVTLQAFGLVPEVSFARAVASSFLCIAVVAGCCVVVKYAGGVKKSILAGTLSIGLALLFSIYGTKLAAQFAGTYGDRGDTSAISPFVASLALGTFILVFAAQTILPHLKLGPHTTVIYATLRNGFYFEALTRRALRQ